MQAANLMKEFLLAEAKRHRGRKLNIAELQLLLKDLVHRIPPKGWRS